MPRGFSLPREVLPTLGGAEDADVLLPLPMPASAAQNRGREDCNVIGKLKRGVTLSQAQAEMDTITARLRRDHRMCTAQWRPHLRHRAPAGTGGGRYAAIFGDPDRRSRFRAHHRLRECREPAAGTCPGKAQRDGGESRTRRRARAHHTAVAHGKPGAGSVGWCARRALLDGEHTVDSPAGAPEHSAAARDLDRWRRAGFHAGAVGTLQVLFGLAPALRVSNLDLQSHLKDSGRGSAGMGAVWAGGNDLRRLLVVSELALSVVLLIGAGLLLRSFTRLLDVPPGFNPKGVLSLGLTMTGRRYANGPAVLQAYRELWQRLESLPGVSAAGGVSALPLSEMYSWGPITIEGRTPPPGELFVNADERIVGGDYFQAMQIPLRRGRFFTAQDTSANPRVALIDEFMAQEYWPNQDPVGKRIHTGGINDADRPWITIVGVVGRVKQYTLDADSRIALYLPQTQAPVREMNVVVRTTANAAGLANAVRQQIRGLDSDLPVYQVRLMEQRVEESLLRRRFSPAVTWRIRRVGAGAGGCRHLRSDGVSGEPGDARNRHSNGVGRYQRRHTRDGAAARDGTGSDGDRNRTRGGYSAGAPVADDAVRRRRKRRAHFSRGIHPVGRGRAPGELSACAACVSD